MGIDTTNTDAMHEILHNMGINLDSKQIDHITKEFMQHLDDMRDFYSGPAAVPSMKCNRCESLKKDIIDLEKSIECYRDSVKRRTGASRVWIDNGGYVMYEI